MTAPLATVLVAVRDGEAHLPRTLESIRDQTLREWECIVVDDASRDTSAEIVERFSAADPRFRLVRRREAGGPYVAVNEVLGSANGRYIVRSDADDISLPDRLEKQVELLEAKDDLRVAASWWSTIDDAGDPLEAISKPPTSGARSLKWSICVASGFVHSTLCIERSALLEIGGYMPVRVAGDYALWCETTRRDWVGVVPHRLVEWRRHGAQMSDRKLDEQISASLTFLKKHVGALTHEEWSDPAVRGLWSPGRWHPVPIDEATDALDRWERGWRADTALSPDERTELRALTKTVRRRVVRYGERTGFTPALKATARWLASWR